MQTININRLKGKIVERGMTVSELAERIGVDKATLYRKLSNEGNSLLVREANTIAEQLGLTSDEAMSIFFPRYVA